MMVKICGITHRGDAQIACEYGAGAIGINFYPRSPRYIAPQAAGELLAGLPDGVLKVGVFVNESPAEIARIAALAGLDVVQLHGDETPQDYPGGWRVWKAFRVTPEWSHGSLAEHPAEAVLLDGPAPGSGAAFDWSRAVAPGQKLVLAGGLGPENVASAIAQVRPWGVDACSRLESSPGRKDPVRLRQFLLAALHQSL